MCDQWRKFANFSRGAHGLLGTQRGHFEDDNNNHLAILFIINNNNNKRREEEEEERIFT